MASQDPQLLQGFYNEVRNLPLDKEKMEELLENPRSWKENNVTLNAILNSPNVHQVINLLDNNKGLAGLVKRWANIRNLNASEDRFACYVCFPSFTSSMTWDATARSEGQLVKTIEVMAGPKSPLRQIEARLGIESPLENIDAEWLNDWSRRMASSIYERLLARNRDR